MGRTDIAPQLIPLPEAHFKHPTLTAMPANVLTSAENRDATDFSLLFTLYLLRAIPTRHILSL